MVANDYRLIRSVALLGGMLCLFCVTFQTGSVEGDALGVSWGGEAAWAGSGTKDPEEAALTLFKEAKTHFEKGDFQGALVRLKEAWTFFQEPVIAVQLAEVHEKLGQPEEALEALVALDEVKLRDRELRQKIEVRKNSLANFLKQPLMVSVVSDVPTSQVRVNDGETRYPPFDILLPRGVHILKSGAVGYRSVERVVTVRGAVPIQVRISLQALTGTLAVKSGHLTLKGLQIIVDGVEWELTADERAMKTTRPRTAKVGKHQVVCWHAGQTKDIQNVLIREGEDFVVDCQSRSAQRDEIDQVLGSVSLGVAVGTGVAGSYLLYAWKQDMDKAERENLNIETNKHFFGGILLAAAVGAGVASYYFYQRAADVPSPKAAANSGQQEGWTLGIGPGPGDFGLGAVLQF